MEKRLEFSEDILFYAWYYVVNDSMTKNRNPLESLLWKQMMQTFESILCNTSDKNGWEWLKKYFINSLIWYLPHPAAAADDDDNDDDDDDDDMERVLKGTLFYELLQKVRTESKKQSDKLLKDKINKTKTEKRNEWKQLISYNVNTKYWKTARQDLLGCLISEYTENDLSEDKYPSSTHFNAAKHYDKNIYLNQLLFRANIFWMKRFKKI